MKSMKGGINCTPSVLAKEPLTSWKIPPFWVVGVNDQSVPSFCYLYSGTRTLRQENILVMDSVECTGSLILVVGQCNRSKTSVSKSG